MTSVIQEVKERLDLAEFLRQYLNLIPAGKNLKALCPFHSEKTPSFMVSPERQMWHCFGCGEGGDIFKFLMKHENLEFHEALKTLAEKAGVELGKVSPSDQKQFGVLYDLNKLAKDFFKKRLWANREALDYLKSRGLKKETVEEFELGFAPDELDALAVHAVNLGHDIKDAERAGLVLKGERGGYRDRFRGRIMFPIGNHFGKTVGFSGRFLERRAEDGRSPAAGLAKYVNSPETPIFSKSRILYGFHKSKNEIKKNNAVFLVEGQMDFLLAWQEGVGNTAAVSGTALSDSHFKTLRRFSENLYLGLDNDEAGFRALERTTDLAYNFDFTVKVVDLGNFKDPAEAVLRSPGFLTAKIKDAKPAMEHFFGRYLSSSEEETAGDFSLRKSGIRELLRKISRMKSPVERSHWLKELSVRSAVEEKALYEEMEGLKAVSRRAAEPRTETPPAAPNRLELIAQKVICLALTKNDFLASIRPHLDLLPPLYRQVYGVLTGEEKESSRLSDLITFLNLKSVFELQTIEPEKFEGAFSELLEELRLEHFRERRRLVGLSVRTAELSGNETALNNLLEEFKDISYEKGEKIKKEK